MRENIIPFLQTLREEILAAFQAFEPSHHFERKRWNHLTGGGGEIALLRGDLFEKAAVNFSAVSGPKLPLQEEKGPFFATGISLITHMMSPHAPTVHMNIRYIETGNSHWFGGGYDLTPMGICYAEDAAHFHSVAQQALGSFYPQFSQNAKEYFYLPHRSKERGVGGIFFDHFNTGDLKHDLTLWKTVGSTFLSAILPIYQKRAHLLFTKEEKQEQLKLRAHYVEFNLLYDRGTKFGFVSGGNPEAILCSMPPLASW